MYEYDASDSQIERLQTILTQNGITTEQLDLTDYIGLTYTELKGMVDAALAWKQKHVGGITRCKDQ